MKTLLWIFFGIAVIGGAWYLFRGLQTPAPESLRNQDGAPSIKIGAVLPLSGGHAAMGLDLQKAGVLALGEINGLGGIDKRSAEIIWEDGKCQAEATTAATQKLVSVDKVKYILGGACDDEMRAGAPIAEAAGVVWISPSAANSDIVPTGGGYAFSIMPPETGAAGAAAQYASANMGAKTAAIISENESSTQKLRQTFAETFENLGGKIVVNEVYASGSSNFRAPVLKIKSSKADVVYFLPQTPATGVAFMKQFKDQKVTSRVLAGKIILQSGVVEQNAKVLEGAIGIEPYFDSEFPAAVEFMENFKQKYNSAILFPRDMVNYYSAFYLLKTAIENVGDDARAVRDWLYAVKDWEHALGKLSFDPNGERIGQYQVLEVRSGRIEKGEIIPSTAE